MLTSGDASQRFAEGVRRKVSWFRWHFVETDGREVWRTKHPPPHMREGRPDAEGDQSCGPSAGVHTVGRLLPWPCWLKMTRASPGREARKSLSESRGLRLVVPKTHTAFPLLFTCLHHVGAFPRLHVWFVTEAWVFCFYPPDGKGRPEVLQFK